MRIHHFGYPLLVLAVVLNSCKKDTTEETPAPSNTNYTTGVFFMNEGNFGANNASISYIAPDGSRVEDLYFSENGIGMGDVLQSAEWHNGNVYAVLNNSAKLEIIGASDFKRKATVIGADYPRYFIGTGNTKGYLSNGAMAGDVKIIDLTTNTITGSIGVGKGPEQMVMHGNTVWVCNSGGWMRDSTVSVIDVTTNSVIHTLDLTDRPMDVLIDTEGYCWVLCAGETVWNSDFSAIEYETLPMLHKINTSNYNIEWSMPAGTLGEHPKSMALSADGASIYIANGSLYKVNRLSGTSASWIDGNFQFVDVSPTGDVWLTETSNFIQASTVHRYTASGTLVSTVSAGIGTSAVEVR